MVICMCVDAGIEGMKMNHSLRTTAGSELFHANVPEKLIQERTGHKSLQALRVYEHTTKDQHQAVSEILAANTDSSYEQYVQQPLQPQPPYQPPLQPQNQLQHQQPLWAPQQSMFNMQCSVNINIEQHLQPPPSVPTFVINEREMLEFLKTCSCLFTLLVILLLSP